MQARVIAFNLYSPVSVGGGGGNTNRNPQTNTDMEGLVNKVTANIDFHINPGNWGNRKM